MSKKLESLVRDLFKILNTVEESDSGKTFHPTVITSCRVMETEKLKNILPKIEEELKRLGINDYK